MNRRCLVTFAAALAAVSSASVDFCTQTDCVQEQQATTPPAKQHPCPTVDRR